MGLNIVDCYYFVLWVIGFWSHNLLMWFIMISDWPMIIGGKPNFSYGQNLCFYPCNFEATVLCRSFNGYNFLFRCGLFPGSSSRNPDPRTTDDKFLMEVLNQILKKSQKLKR